MEQTISIDDLVEQVLPQGNASGHHQGETHSIFAARKSIRRKAADPANGQSMPTHSAPDQTNSPKGDTSSHWASESHGSLVAGEVSPKGGGKDNVRAASEVRPPSRAVSSRKAGGDDRSNDDAHLIDVITDPIPHKRGKKAIRSAKPNARAPSSNHPAQAGEIGLSCRETHGSAADLEFSAQADATGHFNYADHGSFAGSEIIAEVRALWRRRVQWHRAEKSLTLQASAICRGFADGDKTEAGRILKRIEEGKAETADLIAEIAVAPLLAARGLLRAERAAVEKTMAKMVRGLPIYPWAKSVYGFGDLGLAAIIGEAGAISDWRTVSGLWKRFGLAVIDGGRQRMVSGDAALIHGYSPSRRSVAWNIGGGLIGGMGKGPRPLVGEDINAREDWSPYQRLFVERLRFEADRDPAHRKEPVKSAKTGELRESFSSHAANRAKRFVEKRFLRDLWVAWRECERAADPCWLSPGDRKDIEFRRAARNAAFARREASGATNLNIETPPVTHSPQGEAGSQSRYEAQRRTASGQ